MEKGAALVENPEKKRGAAGKDRLGRARFSRDERSVSKLRGQNMPLYLYICHEEAFSRCQRIRWIFMSRLRRLEKTYAQKLSAARTEFSVARHFYIQGVTPHTFKFAREDTSHSSVGAMMTPNFLRSLAHFMDYTVKPIAFWLQTFHKIELSIVNCNVIWLGI
ncbi:hypothetical protein L7F22_033197 [Adiantum nelumboides]|nr:hypothetical protein [Adiantum nelumboides]